MGQEVGVQSVHDAHRVGEVAHAGGFGRWCPVGCGVHFFAEDAVVVFVVGGDIVGWVGGE